MEIITHKIFQATTYLFISGIVFLAYKLARDYTKKKNFKKALIVSFMWCIGISLFAVATLGDSTCIITDYDKFGGACYEYADDGYISTKYEHVATFIYFVIMLYIPVLIGVFEGRKSKIKSTKEKYEEFAEKINEVIGMSNFINFYNEDKENLIKLTSHYKDEKQD